MAENVPESAYRSADANSRDNRDNGRFTAQIPEIDRFWRKVQKGPGCWVWLGGVTVEGYGRFVLATGCIVRAHRYAYELMVGPIPEGYTLDHLDGCLNPSCVHPGHLEPVTNAENLRRMHQRRRQLIGATS